MLRAAGGTSRFLSPFQYQSAIVSRCGRPAALCSRVQFYSTDKGPSIQPPLSQPLGSSSQPNPEPQSNKSGKSSGGGLLKVAVAGSVLGTIGYLIYSEDGRLLAVEKIPQMQTLFDAVNLSTNQKSMKPAPSPTQFKSAAETPVKPKTLAASAAAGGAATETVEEQTPTVQQVAVRSRSAGQNSNSEQRPAASSNEEELYGVISVADDSVKFLFSGKPTEADILAAKRRVNEAEISRSKGVRDREEAKLRAAREEKESASAAYLKAKKRKQGEDEQLNRRQEQTTENNQSLENKLSYQSTGLVEDVSDAARQIKLAIDASREHANILKLALEANKAETAQPHWDMLRAADDLKSIRMNDAVDCIEDLRKRIKEFIEVVDSARKDPLTSKNPAFHKYQEQAKTLNLQLESYASKLNQSECIANILTHYYQLYMKDRVRFHKDLRENVRNAESVPDNKPLSEEELKEVVAQAHSRLFQLKEDIHLFKVLSDQRFVDVSIDQRDKDIKHYCKIMEQKLEEQRAQITAHTQKALKCDADMKEKQLSESLAAQNLELTKRARDTLNCHERQMMKEFEEQTEGALLQQRENYLIPIKEQAEKVERLVSALKEKADVTASVEKVRSLVCVSRQFQADLNPMDKKCEDKLYFLQTYNQLCEMSKSDRFVKSIVDSIPNETVQNGVSSKLALKTRFTNMYEDLQNVSKSAENSNPLMQYVYKALRKFQVEPARPRRTKPEDIDPKAAPSDLLLQAKYFIEQDSLESAVKCMVLIEGAAKLLAKDWLHQARSYLETKQAVQALHSYATACYMGHIV